MSEKRRGLGRGLGALIPTAPAPTKSGEERPVDVFFAGATGDEPADRKSADGPKAPEAKVASKSARPSAEAATVVDPVTVEPIEVDPESGEVTGATVAPPKKAPAAPKPGPKSVPPLQSRGGEPVKPADAEPAPEPEAAEAPAPEPEAIAEEPAAPEPSQSDLLPVPGARFAEIPVESVQPNPKQPRTHFDEEALAELVHSISEIGVLQPIVVRQLPGEGARFELIMGERRLRASKEAGLERIPAIVRDTQDDAMLRDALLENLHRAELNPLEEAAAYQQLLDDFGCTHEELATRIGRSRPQISNMIRLLRLPPAVQRRVAAGVLSAGHARALLGLENADSMDRLAQRIVNEGLSVRATEEAVAISDSDDTAATPRRKPRAGGRNVELDDLASRLADRLDTRVNITLGRSKGKLSVEFASVEDLNRIIELLTPGERGAFKAAAS